MRSVFVTGTDTDIGKTFVSAAIASALVRRGVNVGVMKPVATGGRRHGQRLLCDDALVLKAACGVRDPLEIINPICFESPLAPNLAARVSRRPVELAQVWKAFRVLSSMHDCVIVEGAGGLMVPVLDRYYVADLVQRLRLPLLIVTRPTLGTINHTMLTVMAARQYGLDILGLIINYHARIKAGVVEKLNPDALEQATNVPVLAEIPHLPDASPRDVPAELLDEVLNVL